MKRILLVPLIWLGLTTLALSQPAGALNSPNWATGYIWAQPGTTVFTTITNRQPLPNNINVFAGGPITTWNITFPNPPFDGEIISIGCPSATVGTITLSSTDGSTVALAGVTSCSSIGTILTYQFNYYANTWYNISASPASASPSALSLLHVPTNAVLATYTTGQFPNGVWRDDYAVGNGAPPLFYQPSSSPCSLNSGAGDNGSQVASADGKCWIADFSTGGADLREWGAKCDGTDDHLAIQAAILGATANFNTPIVWPNRGCSSTIGINFANVPVVGASPIVPGYPAAGPTLICNPSIAGPCATFGVSSNDTASSVENLIVAFSGAPIAGDTGFQIMGFNSTLRNVLVKNAWDGYHFVDGISSHLTQMFSWGILNNHIVDDGFPEIYITNARFGGNGGDPAMSNAFVQFTGNDPNTFVCEACQFNLGGQSPKYMLDFKSVTIVNGTITISDSTTDMSVGNGLDIIHSDGTGGPLRFYMHDTTINAPALSMFALNGAPAMLEDFFHHDLLFVSNFTLPATQYDQFFLDDLYILGSFTINGASGAVATMSNIHATGAITLEGGPWGDLKLSNIRTDTSFTDTATGGIFASDIPFVSYTPQLQFGGNNVGLLSASNGTAMRQSDGTVKFTYGITLTAVGSSTGGSAINNLPYTCKGYANGQESTTPVYGYNMAGLTGTLESYANQGSHAIWFVESSSTGLTGLTNSNFTNTSQISGVGSCTPN